MRNRYAADADPGRLRTSPSLLPDHSNMRARRLAKSEQRHKVRTQIAVFRSNIKKSLIYRPQEKVELEEIFQTILRDYQDRVIDSTKVDFIATLRRAYHVAVMMKGKHNEPTATSVDLQK